MRRLLAALGLAVVLLAGPSDAAFDQGNLICETTTTTGTGTVSLSESGCDAGNFVTFASQITSGDTTTYTIVASDGTLETGIGTYTAGSPDTLARTTPLWSSAGSATALTLPAGTHRVYVQWNTASYQGGVNAFDVLSVSVDNLNDVTAIDPTTEGTIETAIDTLANLVSVQGVTVTLTDAGADAVYGWDDSANAYENLTRAEVIAFLGDIALTTETSGNYVATVVDGTAIDGTATGEGSTYTPTLDMTEINTFTLGAGAATGIIFDAGATDPAIEVATGTFTIDIGGTNEVVLNATSFTPGVDAGNELGTAALGWNDLHLDVGGSVNFENGDVLIQQAANDLTFSGVTGDYQFDDSIVPAADATSDLGTSTVGWNDIHFGLAGVINFDGGDVTITHAANDLAFAGVTGDYTFDDTVAPAADATSDLGTTALGWNNLHLDTGATFNIENGDWLATHTAGILTVGTGDLRVTTQGTNTDSVVTVGDNKPTVAFCVAASDETTALTTGAAKITFRMPYAFTLSGIRASLGTAPTTTSFIADVNEAGTTIMTTNKLSIDVTEETTVTAATAPTLTDTSLADDAEMTVDIDQIGSGTAGAGLKVCLIGART